MKTAVEWLVEQLDGERHLTENEIKRLIQQAKEMEEQKLKDAYAMGREGKTIAEFNETFKSE